MDSSRKSKLIVNLLNAELLDYEIFRRLTLIEKDRELRILLGRLTKMEKAHVEIYAQMAGTKPDFERAGSGFVLLKVYIYIITRKLLGVAFVTMLLSRSEMAALERYANLVRNISLSQSWRKQLETIIQDEKYNEADLKKRTREYKSQLTNTRSIVLGMNDGLVEVLAAVSGIAVIATGSLVVVVSGIIIGIAGTLSMAGGVYLSSKSHGLIGGDGESSAPGRDALYTGVYYFLGALVSIIPFALGLNGYPGIVSAVVLVAIVLTTASIIIAVVSGTSIKRRVFEMLAISLGAVLATVILGNIARIYFGVAI